MSELNRLLELTPQVSVPAFDEIIELQRRRARRLWVATATGVAGTLLTVVGVVTATGGTQRSDAPPVDHVPTPTPSETFVVPAGQSVIAVDARPDEIHGWDLLADVSNTQPEHRGATILEGSATVHTEGGNGHEIVSYCRGDSDLWLVRVEYGDGGYSFDRCSPTADTSPAPIMDIAEWTGKHFAETTSARVYVSRPSQAWAEGYEACYRKGEQDCVALFGVPQPLSDPPAEFGFRIYEHPAMPHVLTLLNRFVFEALSTVGGTPWLVDQAVVSGPGADRLAFELPRTKQELLVDVYAGDGAHLQRCVEQHADELSNERVFDAYQAARDKLCGVDLRLVVDGAAVSPAKDPEQLGHFSQLGALLSPGVDHQVVVEVVRGDPRNIHYAVVVRVRTQLP